MTTLRTEHYSGISAEYLRKARSDLDEGDLLQASEKGWGAVAVALKACAGTNSLGLCAQVSRGRGDAQTGQR